ncbi:hypothetical protein B0T17DRAFT_244227 [Bombardia bombarda]|uniref:Secreted protein n=1 Tax=Bombardia bombarda TaxID=252184 RepID=A0AA39WZL5_9PEZI|nr:hypothetical protein B0T17DRAFT_244227 [Bombardia bombarda]
MTNLRHWATLVILAPAADRTPSNAQQRPADFDLGACSAKCSQVCSQVASSCRPRHALLPVPGAATSATCAKRRQSPSSPSLGARWVGFIHHLFFFFFFSFALLQTALHTVAQWKDWWKASRGLQPTRLAQTTPRISALTQPGLAGLVLPRDCLRDLQSCLSCPSCLPWTVDCRLLIPCIAQPSPMELCRWTKVDKCRLAMRVTVGSQLLVKTVSWHQKRPIP